MWIEVNLSSRTMALAEDDRVLVVAALPAHEGAEHVLAERQLAALSVDELSASGWPCVTRSPCVTIGRWLMQVPWLERMNFSSG